MHTYIYSHASTEYRNTVADFTDTAELPTTWSAVDRTCKLIGQCLERLGCKPRGGSLFLPRAPKRAKAASLFPVLENTVLITRPKKRAAEYTSVSATPASF
jgi:hypothetical protein